MKRLTGRVGGTARLIVVAALCAAVVGATGAVAGQLITGKDIKNGSIAEKELKKKLRKKIGKSGTAGAPGQAGATGATGATGPAGPATAATYVGPNWGIIDRNTEGSPLAVLRGGPNIGTAATDKPPLGVGSLELITKDNTEKVAFGNQVDFAGDPVSGLNQVGFSYFVTGEDLGRAAYNTPNIQLEINPHVAGKTYTSMVFNPASPPAAAQQWVNVDADSQPTGPTAGWWFTNGTVASATGCSQATFCTLAQAKSALVAQNDASGAASILTLGVGKGKDFQFQGAVDALRVNDTTYNFEPFGVEEVATP